jgi:GT2 family glycosyltransferase
MQKKFVIFIIPIFHPKKDQLHKLLMEIENYPTIIINNDSKVLEKFSVSQTINNPENIGFAGAVNQGIKIANVSQYEWYIILNQDLELNNTSILELLARLIKAKPGLYGPFGGEFDNRRWTTIINERVTSDREVDYISGSCIAIHKDVVNKIGDFYEPYFMYYEDADLCVRAKMSGFPVVQYKISGITHSHKNILSQHMNLYEYYLCRNHLLFIFRQAPFNIKIYEIIRLPKTYLSYLRANESGAIKGVVDYFKGKFGMSKEIL